MGFEVKIGRNPWGDISSGRLLSLPPQGPFFFLLKSIRACLYRGLKPSSEVSSLRRELP